MNTEPIIKALNGALDVLESSQAADAQTECVDLLDLVAGSLQTSRAHALELMQEAVSNVNAQPVKNEREAFEEAYEADCMPCEADWFRRDQYDPGAYEYDDTAFAWKWWQARAALSPNLSDPAVQKRLAAQWGYVKQEWLPIESAPKTGRTLLLGYKNKLGNWRTVRGQWVSENYIKNYWDDPDSAKPGWFEMPVEADETPNCWRIDPTHWMPLPTPPQGAQE